MCDILMSGQFMPCRSTKCPSWACAFQRFIGTTGQCMPHRSTDVRHGRVFFNISFVPWSFKSCRSTKCRHKVVFSTLGLYACPFSQQVNKLSISDLLVSTFISSTYTQVYPWWSLAGVWYDQFVVHCNCIWALVRSDGHIFLPLLER